MNYVSTFSKNWINEIKLTKVTEIVWAIAQMMNNKIMMEVRALNSVLMELSQGTCKTIEWVPPKALAIWHIILKRKWIIIFRYQGIANQCVIGHNQIAQSK